MDSIGPNAVFYDFMLRKTECWKVYLSGWQSYCVIHIDVIGSPKCTSVYKYLHQIICAEDDVPDSCMMWFVGFYYSPLCTIIMCSQTFFFLFVETGSTSQYLSNCHQHIYHKEKMYMEMSWQRNVPLGPRPGTRGGMKNWDLKEGFFQCQSQWRIV